MENFKMTLQEKIKTDLYISIKNREHEKTELLKVIVAEMSRSVNKNISDDSVISILKMMKEGASITKNNKEIEILDSYLPKLMNDEETKNIVYKIIVENNLSNIKDISKVMHEINNYGHSIDKSIASNHAKNFLMKK